MLAPLDNEVFFKKAFTDKIVFTQFIKDIFGVEVSVDKIETEKRFEPKAGNIDFKLDIFAETTDKRFIIEIQRIDYDYNFDRFLHYFLSTITQQQQSSKEYKMQQEVLGVIVLTQPYTITQKTGEPIQDSVMTLDFNLRNFDNEEIKLWGHNLKFLNPHPKYENSNTKPAYKDWLDLMRQSVQKNVTYTLNLNNPGISKVVDLIDYEHITSEELEKAKRKEGRKIMRKILEQKFKNKLKEKDRELKQKEQKIQQKEQALAAKEQEIQQKEQALKAKEQALTDSAKAMLKAGMSAEQIQPITKLNMQIISKL